PRGAGGPGDRGLRAQHGAARPDRPAQAGAGLQLPQGGPRLLARPPRPAFPQARATLTPFSPSNKSSNKRPYTASCHSGVARPSATPERGRAVGYEVELLLRVVWQSESCEFSRRLVLPFVPHDRVTLREGAPGRGVEYQVREVVWLLGEERF